MSSLLLLTHFEYESSPADCQLIAGPQLAAAAALFSIDMGWVGRAEIVKIVRVAGTTYFVKPR